jgi:hypothetical protein
MRLPGTEQWAKPNLEAQIGFELAFGKAAPALLQIMDAADRDGEPSSPPQHTESIFAWGRAAELAFATEDLQRGVSICAHMVKSERPKTPMQLAFYATVGTLIGAVRVHLDPELAFIKASHHPEPFQFRWPRDDSAYVVTLMRHFLPAAALSGPLPDMIVLLGKQLGAMKPQVQAGLSANIEAQALLGAYNRRQFQAIQTMEANYETRLFLMQSDSFHWQSIQPNGAIIDWPLLCVWGALFQFNPVAEKEIPPSSEAAAFIRWLAHELSSVRKKGQF